MHYHLEIIMPPTTDVDAAVAGIMAPFDENGKDEEGHENRHAFWDWYVIGGRYSGAKGEATYGKDRIDAFYAWCKDAKVTVSGVQMGKQTLQPASQIPMVDAKWNEMFPEHGGGACPLFDHAPARTSRDICRLAEMPEGLTAYHVIIAAPSYVANDVDKDDVWTGPPRAVEMVAQSMWNGVSHVDAKWDGNVAAFVERFKERMQDYREKYRAASTPTADWLVVTVDYHC